MCPTGFVKLGHPRFSISVNKTIKLKMKFEKYVTVKKVPYFKLINNIK